MMRNTNSETPKTQAILQAWMPFKQAIGVTSVHNEEDYTRATKTINVLLDEIGDNEDHPLADVLDFLADQVKSYEDERFSIPKAEPHDVLRFLMEQHGLHQEDLSDCAPQSRISEILAGKRSISKENAKRFARRFNVHTELFL
ncbi:MAG TPA: helix-turn-helix domain-containing protein [Methylobacter sp.]|jgi:HTH-type transcriptional regulator/antitoxin HigA